jgi:hypothetical protein
MKEKIKIIWFQYENSMGFTGWRVGYRRQDGLVGDFAESLIEEYDKIYDISWVEEIKLIFNDYKNTVNKITNKND